jgi:hypothetical protein
MQAQKAGDVIGPVPIVGVQQGNGVEPFRHRDGRTDGAPQITVIGLPGARKHDVMAYRP